MNNHTVSSDPMFSDNDRRRRLYEGQVVVSSPRGFARAVRFARFPGEIVRLCDDETRSEGKLVYTQSD